MKYRLNTISEVRHAFWDSVPHAFQFTKTQRLRMRQNDYSATVRCDFVDFVDHLAKSGDIPESLADRATL